MELLIFIIIRIYDVKRNFNLTYLNNNFYSYTRLHLDKIKA